MKKDLKTKYLELNQISVMELFAKIPMNYFRKKTPSQSLLQKNHFSIINIWQDQKYASVTKNLHLAWESATELLILSWQRSLSYRNQSINLLWKSMDWFLYDKDLRHERFKKINWSPHWLTYVKAHLQRQLIRSAWNTSEI